MSQVEFKTDTLPPGAVIGGKYVIERVIGVGGVGIVYAAKHTHLDDHRVAIKVLKAEVQANTDVVGRFAREAQAAVRIKSEHAVRVFDVGIAPEAGPYLVMELLEGRDLGDALSTSGRMSPKIAVDFAVQVCEALAVSHTRGIVHRDIKPENLFLARREDGTEVVKVLDFGISKAALTGSVFGGDGALIETKSLMGSPLYMSPEQMRSTGTVDPKSDIWSLGVVLYELLAGRPPFSGDTITSICAEVLERDPPPVTAHAPETPSGLANAVAQCLAKNPDLRFGNVAELAHAIAPYGSREARVLSERVAGIFRASGRSNTRAGDVSESPGGVAEDEAPPTYPSQRPSPVPPTPPTQRSPPRASARAVLIAAIAATLLFAIAVTAYAVHARNAARRPLALEPPPSQPPSAAVTASATPPTVPSIAVSPPTTGVPSIAVSLAQTPTARPVAMPYVPPRRAPPPPPVHAPPPKADTMTPAAGASCNPPYYYEGPKKLFKPGCI